MPKDREAKAVEVISRIRTSQGKSELKAIAELKVLYLDIIEKRVKKIINKYKDIGSEKYDGEIAQIYEDIFKSAASNFDPQVNDNFVAYLRLGWKKFQAEAKVLELLYKYPSDPPPVNPKGKQDNGEYDPIGNLQEHKAYHSLNTAEFNMLMSDLCLSFDISYDLLLPTISGRADSCEKRFALNKMACMAAQNETNIKTAQLLGSALQRRNWWVEWTEKKSLI